MKKKQCLKCQNWFCVRGGYPQHIKTCVGKQKKERISAKEEWKQPNGQYKCPECDLLFSKMGIGFHIWKNHTKDGRNFKSIKKGDNSHSWNKGKTKDDDPRIAKQGETYSQRVKEGKIIPSQLGVSPSKETRKKISESRKKYLEKNPDQVPYLLNHYSKGNSYPEKYFKEIFENEKIVLDFHHRIGLYELDFANVGKKIDIEIDGEQHYADERIVESDKRRTEYLEDLGWFVYRIRWSEYQKLIKSEKENVISDIRQLIDSRT